LREGARRNGSPEASGADAADDSAAGRIPVARFAHVSLPKIEA
jgi:hypothetical protein